MELDVVAAVIAGLVGTAVMTVVLYAGIVMMPQQMTMNLLYMLGTMMTRNKGMAYVVGAMMHTLMGIIFALIHALGYQVLSIESGFLLWGLIFGFVHYLVVGMGMGMVGSMHQLMRSGELESPGFFVKNYPAMTAMGFLMLHLLYGVVVSVVYEANI